MRYSEAQNEMNYAYYAGVPGVFTSGLVWCIAGVIALFFSNQVSMLMLFLGGMFIHPITLLLSKALKRPAKHTSENPLGKLALESTVILFIGLFLAFYVAKLHVEWFYPIMLMIIGVRYLIFNTLYGTKIYWLLGSVLIFSGMLCILYNTAFIVGAFVGGVTEIVFSFIILNQVKKIE